MWSLDNISGPGCEELTARKLIILLILDINRRGVRDQDVSRGCIHCPIETGSVLDSKQNEVLKER